MKLLSNQAKIDDRALCSFLYRIATNVCLNTIRMDRNHASKKLDLSYLLSMVEPSNAWVSKNFLERVFSGQKELTNYIAILFHLDGMTHEEVANEVGLSVSGVRKHLKRLEMNAFKVKESE